MIEDFHGEFYSSYRLTLKNPVHKMSDANYNAQK